MKKYKIIKGLVLFIALFAVACFFTPFAFVAHKSDFGSGLALGFDFIIGTSDESAVLLGIWVTRFSAVIAIAAVAFAVLPLIFKDANGLNKRGEFHKSLCVSSALSFLSAIMNFVSILIGFCKEIEEVKPGHAGTYRSYYEFYTYIGLICIIILLVPTIVLGLKAKQEIANLQPAPQAVKTVESNATNAVATQPEIASEKPVSNISVAESTSNATNAVATQPEIASEKSVSNISVAESTTNADEIEKAEKDGKKPKIKNKFTENKTMAGIYKFVKGFIKGIKRGHAILYGDLEGPMTTLKSGKMGVSIENEKCIAWTVGCDDVELSPETVESFVFREHKVVPDCCGRKCDVDIYTITMKNGHVGTLRIIDNAIKYQVLRLLGIKKSSVKSTDKVSQLLGLEDYDNEHPQNKPLEWFSSEVGLNAYKTYVTAQNYMLSDAYAAEYKSKNLDCGYAIFLSVYHKEAKLPEMYFVALIVALNVQPMTIADPSAALITFLKEMAKPFKINEDGEPEARKPVLTPEQIVSVEQNPLLYFVKRFDVFEIKDDALGTATDKVNAYITALMFIADCVGEIDIEKMQWLFDKNTYLNDFGTVRKQKGFLKKCKEVSGFPEYFDALLKLYENN